MTRSNARRAAQTLRGGAPRVFCAASMPTALVVGTLSGILRAFISLRHIPGLATPSAVAHLNLALPPRSACSPNVDSGDSLRSDNAIQLSPSSYAVANDCCSMHSLPYRVHIYLLRNRLRWEESTLGAPSAQAIELTRVIFFNCVEHIMSHFKPA